VFVEKPKFDKVEKMGKLAHFRFNKYLIRLMYVIIWMFRVDILLIVLFVGLFRDLGSYDSVY
jgi:hypothetical protein